MKRSIILMIVCMFLTALSASSALAADWPDGKQPVKLINPFGAGGTGDIELRMIAPLLETKIGVPVVVENLTGAGGRICMEKNFKAKVDGHTLIYANMPAANLGEWLYKGRYKMAEYTFLVNVVQEYRFVAVTAASPYKTFKDLLEASKTKPLTCANSGLGSSGHLGSVLMAEKVGLMHDIVPFDGNAPAKAAFLGGHVDFWMPGHTDVKSLVKEGKIALLAALAPHRLEGYDDVPTLKELGYMDVPVYTARGLVAPSGMDPALADKITTTLKEVLDSPKFLSWAKEVERPLNTAAGKDYVALFKETGDAIEAVLPIIQKSINQ